MKPKRWNTSHCRFNFTTNFRAHLNTPEQKTNTARKTCMGIIFYTAFPSHTKQKAVVIVNVEIKDQTLNSVYQISHRYQTVQH